MDLYGLVWTMPAAQTKAGREHRGCRSARTPNPGSRTEPDRKPCGLDLRRGDPVTEKRRFEELHQAGSAANALRRAPLLAVYERR